MDIVRSRSSSLGEERAKNDLKLSAVVRGKDVQTIWWGSVQVDFLGHYPREKLINYFHVEKGIIGRYAC